MSGIFTKSMARNIFYGGTVFFFLLFLALTFDSHKEFPKRDNSQNLTPQVIAGKKLDLLGCLAADNLNLARWAEGVDHKIVYDPAFKRNNDLYQVNIARWVTFERMVEQDE